MKLDKYLEQLARIGENAVECLTKEKNYDSRMTNSILLALNVNICISVLKLEVK